MLLAPTAYFQGPEPKVVRASSAPAWEFRDIPSNYVTAGIDKMKWQVHVYVCMQLLYSPQFTLFFSR
jgi:hypothetical protein